MRQFPVYLFDVDGTLVDSAADICAAIQLVLSTTRQNAVTDDFLRFYIGRHLLDLFQDLIPELTPEQVEHMIADYRRIYLARNHCTTSVFPGVAEAPGRATGPEVNRDHEGHSHNARGAGKIRTASLFRSRAGN